jgi:hypothetical protein
MNTSLSPRLVPFWAALGALAITAGCTAVPPAPLAANPVNPTPDQVDVSNDALTVLAADADFEAPLTQESAQLSSAEDLGLGDTIQALKVQDLSGAYGGNFPTPFGSTLASALSAGKWVDVSSASAAPWMKDRSGNLLFPKTVVHGTSGSSVERYYVCTATGSAAVKGFAYSRTATHDGKTVEEVMNLPETTGDLSLVPAPFKSLSGLPAQVKVRRAAQQFFTYCSSGSSAIGYTWSLHDAAKTGTPLVASIRSLQIARPGGVTLQHYDVATRYGTDSGRKIPFEYITDDYNVTSGVRNHQDKTYAPGSKTWTGVGTFTEKNGNTRTVTETWSTATLSKTRSTSWTSNGHKIALSQSFNSDRSGTGTISVDGAVTQNLAWTKDGQGTMTDLKTNRVKSYRTHY